MQNKKFLSTLLVLVMICACAFGMLVTGAGARETDVPVAFDGDLAAAIASINGDEFDATEQAVIEIPAGKTVNASVKNGVLFGVETIFDSTGARLPIVIKGEDETATITFDGVSGDVSCSNSYTFQGLNFFIADAEEQINFYAGSGEVVLDTVVLSKTASDNALDTVNAAWFYADNASAYAYSNWSDEQINVAKGEGALIPTSLTLKNVNYSWAGRTGSQSSANASGQVGVVGAQADFANEAVTSVTAAMTKAELIIEDSSLAGVYARRNTAKSPVAAAALTVKDSSETPESSKEAEHNTLIYRLNGVGAISAAGAKNNCSLPNFDFTVNIEGGYFYGDTVIFRGAMFTGNVDVTVSGGYFKNEFYVAHGDSGTTGDITGNIAAKISGGYFANTLFGPNGTGFADADAGMKNTVEISGGTIATYQGNRVTGSIETTVKGGKITTYHGCYSSNGAGGTYGYVINNIEGGEIGTYYGSGKPANSKAGTTIEGDDPTTDKVETTYTELVPGYSNVIVTSIVNNFNGGTVTGPAYGAGIHKQVVDVTNNFNGTTFKDSVHGTYYGSYVGNYGEEAGQTVYVCTNVTGTLTNNVNTAAGWANVNTETGIGFFPIGYSIPGDLVLNLNASQKKYAGFAPVSFPAAEVSVNNFTLNAVNVSGWSGETYLNDLYMKGDATFNFTNCASNSHVGMLHGGKVDGDLNVNIDTMNFTSTAINRWILCYDPLDDVTTSTADAIGGDINVSLKKVTNTVSKVERPSIALVFAGRRASGNMARYLTIAGNVNVTFEDCKLLSWVGNHSEIEGTYSVTYKGTNTFADGAFPSNNARVGKQVNNLAGTFDGIKFYGTGAPVGSYVPSEIEGGEPIFVPGTVENNIYSGATFGHSPKTDNPNYTIFFGTGEQEVKSVTTNMYGGRIHNYTGASSEPASGIGCYYGNLGNVTEKVVNNIYSGQIGENFFGSNGDLECPVYTNIGNNLYAELYPEAEELSQPSINRIAFAGGRYYTEETVDTTTVKHYFGDAQTGSTGPVYVNVDGASLARARILVAGATADQNGKAVTVSIKNATENSSDFLFQGTKTQIVGDVDITFDNFTMNRSNLGANTYSGPSDVKGNVTYTITGNSYFQDQPTLADDVDGNIAVTIDGATIDATSNGVTKFASGIVTGTATVDIKNATFGGQAQLFSQVGTPAAGEEPAQPGALTVTMEKSQFSADSADSTVLVVTMVGPLNITATEVATGFNFTDYSGAGAFEQNSSLTAKYVKCDFTGYSTQFTNRKPTLGSFQEFDSCTFASSQDGSIRTNMQIASADLDVTFIYGDTVVGNGEFNTVLSVGRNTSSHVTYLGAKPDANGNPVAAETVITINDKAGLYAAPADKANQTTKTYIYDITIQGTGIFAPIPDSDGETSGYQYNAETVPELILVGNIEIGETSPEIYINGAESTGTVSAVGGNWIVDKTYITAVGDASIDNISGRSFGNANGYAAKVDNSLVGAAFTLGEVMVSMDVAERISINLWIPAADVEAFLSSGMKNTAGEVAYDYWASIDLANGEKFLGEGALTEANKAEYLRDNYYVVTLGTVAANNFDKDIEFAGATFKMTNSILAIAQAGYEGDYTEDELNLFKAIYNYGASVCEGYEMVEMAGFVQDTALAAPVYQKGSVEGIDFTSMSLLMGDAIGIRFNGTIVKADTKVSMTVNGEETNEFKYDAEKGTIDVYVNMENVNDELTIIVYTDAAPAIAVRTSIKGYTEMYATGTGAELAVAQLAQACAAFVA